MAHHRVGRGGRGYGILPSEKEDQKLGISAQEKGSATLPAQLQGLLLGRGRANPFARGTPLFPSLSKPPLFVGRGSVLGASGAELLGLKEPLGAGSSGVKPGGVIVDPNDNTISLASSPERLKSEQSLKKQPRKPDPVDQQSIPGLSSIQKSVTPSMSTPDAGLGQQEPTSPPSLRPTGMLSPQEKVHSTEATASRLGTSPQKTQAKSPTRADDILSILSRGRGQMVPAGFPALGRGSVFLGRGRHIAQSHESGASPRMVPLAPQVKGKSPSSPTQPELGRGRHIAQSRADSQRIVPPAARMEASEPALPQPKQPQPPVLMQLKPQQSEPEAVAILPPALKPTPPSTPLDAFTSLLASGPAGSGRGRGVSARSSLLERESPAALSPQGPVARHVDLQGPVRNEFLLRKPAEQTPKPAPKIMESKGADFKIMERSVVKYHGSTGSKVPIRINCVRVKCRNEAVYQYHISFDPPIDNRNLRYVLLNQHREVIGNTKAFDGTILYLPICLKHPETILTSKRITDDKDVQLKITLTAKLNTASHLLLPFYNVVLHRCMRILNMCPVGRNYYDPAAAQPVPKYKLQLWPGYVTAIREMEGGLLMNIDTSHKVLRNETVLSLMQDIFRSGRENFRTQCIKEIIGATVLTRYNNNNYRVDDIDWEMTPMSSFTNSRGETITFYDYYKTQYKIEIKDLKQPMLINRPKKATQRGKRAEAGEERVLSLVPELCFLTGLSERLTSDFNAMKDIGVFTRLGPTERSFSIESFLHRVNDSPEARQELLRWGLELDTQIVGVEGRNFPSEKVLVGNNHVFTCNEEVDFFRDISRVPMLRAVPINSWIIVFTGRDATKAKDFVKKFEEVSRKIGMQLRPPRYIELRDDRSDAFKSAISSAVSDSLQLVVCIFPTSRDDRYNAVKKLCCVDMPVPSQVILSKTLPRDPSAGKFRSVTMKIAMQINCKLGGELWALDIPLSGLMVCGIDVFHEGREAKGKSVAGLVASMNKLMTRWFSRAVIQLPQQEIVDGLKECFCDTLKRYYEVNHKLPDRIVVYRDGVGDGRLPTVAEHEVKQLQSTLNMFDKIAGGKYDPKLTIVVVSKRINIRYFQEAGKKLINPPPGTVIDHTVTRPNWPDFYLVSQHVRQGTVSPTHYVAIHGSELLKPDHLQRLTYKLTHMYYNWPGTVRVPAPCQYAHKLAYLVGENIRKEPAVGLCDRLFYL